MRKRLDKNSAGVEDEVRSDHCDLRHELLTFWTDLKCIYRKQKEGVPIEDPLPSKPP